MPYACEVYPTFRFDLNVKSPEVASQQSSAGELPKTFINFPNALNKPEQTELVQAPLKLTGVLDAFESFDLTPAIGKEFPKANITEWLQAPNADALIRDLAVTVSQRSVVFFRAQDQLTNDLQKTLCQKLGKLAGKPADSTLHTRQISNNSNHSKQDNEINNIIDRKTEQPKKQKLFTKGWHSDISFQLVPSDFAILKLTDLPSSGGDTLWASGYEVYNYFSPPYQKFLDGLTATHAQPLPAQTIAHQKLHEAFSSPPFNASTNLSTSHPVVRTNPVTGWKSIFAVGQHVQHIDRLTKSESSHLLGEFLHIVTANHDLQVRFRWNRNDIAIWDSRSTFHTPTCDYDGESLNSVQYCVGIGERPYFDPTSKSKREAENSGGDKWNLV